MGLYCLKLDALSKYTGISVEELKEKSYKELESMIHSMDKAKNYRAEQQKCKR